MVKNIGQKYLKFPVNFRDIFGVLKIFEIPATSLKNQLQFSKKTFILRLKNFGLTWWMTFLAFLTRFTVLLARGNWSQPRLASWISAVNYWVKYGATVPLPYQKWKLHKHASLIPKVFELMAFQKSKLWLTLLPNSDIWKLRWGLIPF